jgi:hypothetical protein
MIRDVVRGYFLLICNRVEMREKSDVITCLSSRSV